MLKRATAVMLLSAAFAAGTATAQVHTGTQQGGTAAPAATQAQTGTNASVRYITENRRDLWRASQLDGVNVYNETNEHIGDITEVLLNKQGQVEAVVIGVGGFLGIGQRDVAVPFASLQWEMGGAGRVAEERGTGTTGAATRGGVVQPAPGPTAGETARNATTTAGAMTGTTAAAQINDRPERAILPGATKDQLGNAPEFRFAR